MEPLKVSTRDGINLYVESMTVEHPIGMVCIIHGFGEHIGRYRHVMQSLNASKFNVYGVDLRGHGKSGGLKGHAPDLMSLINDIEEFLKIVRAEHLYLPLFLFGHSMGGNLVLNYVIRDKSKELSGFIVSAPWIKLAFTPPRWKEQLGKLMARIAPKIRQSNGLNSLHLSKDPEVSKLYDNDPLVNFKISAGLFAAINFGASYLMKHQSEIKLSGFVFHGQSDSIIDHKATMKLVLDNPDYMKWKLWKDVFHEAHNDLEQKEVIKEWIDWMISKIKISKVI
jgi:acylglycerol lipase